jgi:hypothetical protein
MYYVCIGRVIPCHKEELAKYSSSRVNKLIELFNPQVALGQCANKNNTLCTAAKELIAASYSKNTWAKNLSGWKAFANFEFETCVTVIWPVSIETIRSFAVWCLECKKLQVDTVKAYINAVVLAHHLQGVKCKNFSDDKILKLLLNGAENLQRLNVSANCKRRVATLDTILLLGHRIAVSNWSQGSKIVFWSLCTTAFFSSARIGELLSASEIYFDKTSDLLWKDIQFNTNHILIHVKNPKTKSAQGDFLDVFKFVNENCCPYTALVALKKFQMQKGYFSESLPVFRFDNGKNLTQPIVNRTLKLLLSDLYVPGQNSLSGHSFRAGIPSVLTNNDMVKGEAVSSDWGRWKSGSYKSYCRLKTNLKSELFDIISECLNK